MFRTLVLTGKCEGGAGLSDREMPLDGAAAFFIPSINEDIEQARPARAHANGRAERHLSV